MAPADCVLEAAAFGFGRLGSGADAASIRSMMGLRRVGSEVVIVKEAGSAELEPLPERIEALPGGKGLRWAASAKPSEVSRVGGLGSAWRISVA